MNTEWIRTDVGAYRQEDLEAMPSDRLEALAEWAAARFDDHADTHPEEPFVPECEACTYFELLAGAAQQVADGRGRKEGD